MVGYMNAPFTERTILHGDARVMPFEYNNVKTPHYCEAERSWDLPRIGRSTGLIRSPLLPGLPDRLPGKRRRLDHHGRRHGTSGATPTSSASPTSVSAATARCRQDDRRRRLDKVGVMIRENLRSRLPTRDGGGDAQQRCVLPEPSPPPMGPAPRSTRLASQPPTGSS